MSIKMQHNKNKRMRAGFTLVELIVTLAIFAIVISGIYSFFMFQSATFSRGSDKSQMQSDIRLASDFIASELRTARKITMDSGQAATWGGEVRQIYLDGNGTTGYRLVSVTSGGTTSHTGYIFKTPNDMSFSISNPSVGVYTVSYNMTGKKDNSWTKSEVSYTNNSVVETLNTSSISGALTGTHIYYQAPIALVTIPLTGISLPASATIAVGETIILSPTFTPTDTTEKSVVWTTSNELQASVVNGKITGVSPGTVSITASGSGGLTATCSVTVENAPVVAVTGVTVFPSTLTIGVSNTTTLNATVSPSNANNKDVTWSSDNPTCASVNPSTGVVTGNAVGSAIITATTDDGGKQASCTITVQNSVTPVTGVTLPATSSLKVGNTLTLTPDISPKKATDKSVTWYSNHESIATVSATGVVTGVSEGTVTIKVKTNDGGFEANCVVSVTLQHITGISLAPKKIANLKVGGTDDLIATITPSDASDKKVTWSVPSGDSVVSFTPTNGTTLKITGANAGTVIVTVTSLDGNYSDSCEITVSK